MDKRISAFAGMLQPGTTIYDLEEAELYYAVSLTSLRKAPMNCSPGV